MSTPITEDQIRQQLANVPYPGFTRDIVSFGLVKEVTTDGVNADIHLALATSDADVPQTIKNGVETAVKSLEGIGRVNVRIDIQAPTQQASQQPTEAAGIPGIKHIIAIASGKGGVGKSTISANLAAALKAQGASVGICDCDIYGPSVAHMFGTRERPYATEDNLIIPIEAHGLKLMSMGFLLEDDSPAVLRGPLVTRYTQQFLRNVDWGNLDYLILDLPPGTGDIQLTIVQTVALDGAIVVTTPQEVALIDARKAMGMFEKVNVRVLGIIENMSFFLCPSDGVRYDIFGTDGGKKESERLGIPLLAQVPIDIAAREHADAGTPIVIADPQNPASKSILDSAASIHQILA